MSIICDINLTWQCLQSPMVILSQQSQVESIQYHPLSLFPSINVATFWIQPSFNINRLWPLFCAQLFDKYYNYSRSALQWIGYFVTLCFPPRRSFIVSQFIFLDDVDWPMISWWTSLIVWIKIADTHPFLNSSRTDDYLFIFISYRNPYDLWKQSYCGFFPPSVSLHII